MKFKFQNSKFEGYFWKLDCRLRMLACEFDWLSQDACSVEAVVTSMWRSDGVHSFFRAIDLRDKQEGSKALYKPHHRKILLGHFNRMYPRTDGKKTLIWHRAKKKNGKLGPPHWHLQVPPGDGILKRPYLINF